MTAATSATDVAIQKKTFVSGIATLIFSNELDDMMKIVKSFEDAGLLIKGWKWNKRTKKLLYW